MVLGGREEVDIDSSADKVERSMVASHQVESSGSTALFVVGGAYFHVLSVSEPYAKADARTSARFCRAIRTPYLTLRYGGLHQKSWTKP